MTQKNLSHIKGIIWDLDDTLYKVTPALHKSMRESIAASVVQMGHPISYEDALKLAEESQSQHRLTVKILVDKFRISHEDLHLPFHANMDHRVTDICPDLPKALKDAETLGIQHIIMTHASREWALRMISHMGVSEYFKPENVFGLEDIGFEKKEDSPRATQTGLDIMKLQPHQVLFAEDRAHNLSIPHGMGLTTALIHHPSQPKELPAHVDYRFVRAAGILNKIYDDQSTAI